MANNHCGFSTPEEIRKRFMQILWGLIACLLKFLYLLLELNKERQTRSGRVLSLRGKVFGNNER